MNDLFWQQFSAFYENFYIRVRANTVKTYICTRFSFIYNIYQNYKITWMNTAFINYSSLQKSADDRSKTQAM